MLIRVWEYDYRLKETYCSQEWPTRRRRREFLLISFPSLCLSTNSPRLNQDAPPDLEAGGSDSDSQAEEDLLEDGDEEDEEGDNDYEAEYFDNGEDDDNDDLGGGGGDGGGDGEHRSSLVSARFTETDAKNGDPVHRRWNYGLKSKLLSKGIIDCETVLYYITLQKTRSSQSRSCENCEKCDFVV